MSLNVFKNLREWRSRHSLSRGFCLISVRSVVEYIFAVVTKNNAVRRENMFTLALQIGFMSLVSGRDKLCRSSVHWIAQCVERRSTVETRRCAFESPSRQPIFRCTPQCQNNMIELKTVLLLSSLQEMNLE
jgi:hypothetical protein